MGGLAMVRPMYAWLLALVFVMCSGIVGFYVGALRVAVTTIALLVSLFFLKPLGALCAKVLPMVGVSHPVLLAVLGPLLCFVILLVVAKVSAQTLHKQLDNFFKYKASDTQRLLFERMNQRTGPCVGVLNGTLYTLLISILATGVGYASVQFSRGAERDSFVLRGLNRLAMDVESSGLSKAVGPYIPAAPVYYDITDIAAEWFHQPLVQGRLGAYPPLLPMTDRKEFEELGNDVKVQEFMLRGPTVSEILDHPKLGPVMSSPETLAQGLKLVQADLADLKNYLSTQKSEKYDSEKILGRWDFNLAGTVLENKKARRMSGLEVNKMRSVFAAQLEGAIMLALLDQKLIVRRPSASGTSRREGAWKSEGGGKYILSFPVTDDKKLDLSVTVEGRTLSSTLLNYQILFDR